MTQIKNKPVHSIRVGLLQAAIWENPTAASPFSVTLERRYRLRGTDEWKGTSSLRADDLLNAAKLLSDCWRWIGARSRETRGSTSDTSNAEAAA